MSLKWNQDVDYDLGFYRLINHILGIYPFDCNSIPSIVRMLIILILNGTMLCQQAMDVIYNCGKIEEIIESIVGVLTYPVAIAKIILPRVYYKNMRTIVESAIEDWSRDIDSNCRKSMMKWVAIGRFIFLLEISSLCVLLTYTTISHFPLSALLQDATENVTLVLERTLPWGSGCWLPSTLSNSLFLIVYFTTCVQQITGSLSNMGFDVSMFIILSHMCGQLDILRVDLEIDVENHLVDYNVSIKSRETYRMFIARHNHLLKLCALFEETFSTIILIHMAMYVGLVTILLFNSLVAWKYQNIPMVIKAVGELMIIYIQLFVYCYAGEKLTNQLEDLRENVYASPWYNLSHHTMRDVSFILRRLNDPFYLTCKFYRMNMDSFKNIIKVTASYCSVIRLLFDD